MERTKYYDTDNFEFVCTDGGFEYSSSFYERENQKFFRGKIHSWELEGSIETCLSFLRIATDFCIDFTVIDLFLSQQAGEPARIVFEISHNRVEYFFESRDYSLQANRISFSDKFG